MTINPLADLDEALALKEVSFALSRSFKDAGLPTPELDARLLIEAVTGLDHAGIIMKANQPIGSVSFTRLQELATRRLAGEPVSRIIGVREFWSLPFFVNEHVLDPRPDSETMVSAALEVYPDREAALRVLDLGVGSGCLLLSLLFEFQAASGLGVDVSDSALETARTNAARLGLSARSAFLSSDWFAKVSGPFDLIISNPPYIPTAEIEGLAVEVKRHDPHLALDGGAQGFDAFEVIIATAPAYLAPAGWLLLECGAGQAPSLINQLSCVGAFSHPRIFHDLAGIERVIATQKRDG